MKHLFTGQHQKALYFSPLHWSPHGSLVSTGQHFITTRVVHLPKRTETSLITEAALITKLDQAVLAVHSCNSWFFCHFYPHCTLDGLAVLGAIGLNGKKSNFRGKISRY